MGDGGDVSEADSDETIVEGSVVESELEEEELRGNRLFLIDENMALATENNITKGIRTINGEELSPEIQFIFKRSDNLPILRDTELIDLLHQGSNEEEDSQSLLQSGINCPVFAADISQADCPQVAVIHGECQHLLGLDSEVDGYLEIPDRNLPQRLNNEGSPERSLLSGMEIKDSITKCAEVPEVFQCARMTSKGKDMTDKGPSLETLELGMTTNKTMAEQFEKDLVEPLIDSETLQMFDVLEYQDDPLCVDSLGNEESSVLPAELLIALNSLPESVAASAISHSLEEDTMVEKHLIPDQTDDDYTQITDTNLKSQFNSQHPEETEALVVTKLVCPSEEQTDRDKSVRKLVCSGHQNIISHERPAEKGNSKDTSSCEQPDQGTSYAVRKSTERGKDFTVNHVDPNSSCQTFVEEINQQICGYEGETRLSTKDLDLNTKDKTQECSQLRNGSFHCSSSDMNFKVEQVRKSQRIAKKKKQMASKTYPNDSYNCITPSSVNRRDIFGQTLLHRAAMEDDLDSIRARIKAGADVNVQDHAGWTPLHKTSVAGFFEATNELLKAGADVNCKGNEQVTPLHDAVKEGHYKVAELLLWYGADPLFKNERGKSALEESTDKHMRKLLERYIAKSSTSSASAERLTEDPVSGRGRVKKRQMYLKIKTRSNEKVQHSFIDTNMLKQQSVRLKKNKRKGNSQSNSACKTQNDCRIWNATTLKRTCSVLKTKQSDKERLPFTLGTAGEQTEINCQGNRSGHRTSLSFTKRTVGSLEYDQHNSDRTHKAAEELSMHIGSEIQQESDSRGSNNEGSSERKEAYQCSELAGTAEGQMTNSCTLPSLNPVQKESAVPSVTNLLNEPNLQKERSCTLKHGNNTSPCLKGNNLHPAENILVCTFREESINPACENYRSPEQHMHFQHSVDKINLNPQRGTILVHELGLKQSEAMSEEHVYSEEKLLESNSTTTPLVYGIVHLSDSDCTFPSEQHNLNADQNPDKNTCKAVGICSEESVQVNMEKSSTCSFPQGINSIAVSPDTYTSSHLRLFTPSVHDNITMEPYVEGNVKTCSLERAENDYVKESNTFVTSQIQDKEPFQGDEAQQNEIPERCCSEANGHENSENMLAKPLHSNELETTQNKTVQLKCKEDCQNAHWCSNHTANNVSSNQSQFSQTEKPQITVSSHSNEKEKKVPSQLLRTTTARINKRNSKGETRLHLAAKKGDLSLVKSLIESGACVNLKDNAGWTAIHEASNWGFTEIIAELLKAGADVNSKSLDGVLPIHDAVSGNHFEAVQFLLLHDANPNERDNCGRSALDEATCGEMEELLKSYGATETKEIPSVSDVVEERDLRPSRAKKIRSCYDCHENNNLVLQPTSASQKCGTKESISKVLQEVEENQQRLLLFELRSQIDADLYIQDLSQIQNTLNATLAKQKSERDELAKKYRASVESFKQGALREQLVELVSRQKRLLLMAQKQKELGQKIQNYKTSRKEFSSSAKQISKNVHDYCERSNTKQDTYDKTVPCPDVVKTSWVMEHSFLDQEPSQYPNRSLNIPVGNGEAIGQKEVNPQNLVGENMLKEYNIQKLVNSESSNTVDQAILPSEPVTSCIQQSHLMEIDNISVTLQRNKPLNAPSRICTPNGSETGSSGINNSKQPATESQHVFNNESFQQHSNIKEAFQMQPESTCCYLTTQKNTLPKNRISFTANLEPAGMFSKNKITQTTSDSAKQLNLRTNRRKKNQLVDLIEQGKLKPGNDVLEFMLQDYKHKASLLENGRVKTGNNSIYQNLVQWIKALLGNDITVRYCGTLLSEIIAEVHVPQALLQKKNLPAGRNSIERGHNQDGEHSSFSQNTSSFQDMCNIQQEIPCFFQEGGSPPSPEVEAKELPSSICKIKLSSQSTSLKTHRRFLQFNKIVLIQDEEFLPFHTMEQYWDFYVHCENFGF